VGAEAYPPAINTPWDEFDSIAEDFMATYGTQEANEEVLPAARPGRVC
jgi:hypothetical protein